MEKQPNYVRAAFLDNRVKELLKPKNFYFFKIFGENTVQCICENLHRWAFWFKLNACLVKVSKH